MDPVETRADTATMDLTKRMHILSTKLVIVNFVMIVVVCDDRIDPPTCVFDRLLWACTTAIWHVQTTRTYTGGISSFFRVFIYD